MREETWLGPATVVFQDCKVVYVRHGGVFVRFNPTDVRIHDKVYRTESREITDDCKEHNDSINETSMEEFPLQILYQLLKILM